MNVVMIYKYGKRWSEAESFNKRVLNIQKNSNKTGKAFSLKRCSKDFITDMEVAHKPMTIQQQENKKTTKMLKKAQNVQTTPTIHV